MLAASATLSGPGLASPPQERLEAGSDLQGGHVADRYEELDDATASVLDQSAELVDESRALLRRIDHLLDGTDGAVEAETAP